MYVVYFSALLFLFFCHLAIQFKDRSACFNILLSDDFLFLPFYQVGLYILCCGELSDLLDTLRVEDILGAEKFYFCLLEKIYRAVIEDISVKICSDDVQNFGSEFTSSLVQLNE